MIKKIQNNIYFNNNHNQHHHQNTNAISNIQLANNNSSKQTYHKTSILPSPSQNNNPRPVNQIIEDYLLHNLTDPQKLTLKPGVVSIQYMSDSTYIGQIGENQQGNNNKEGKGVYKYSNSDIYMGDWHKDTFNGLGMYIFGNGDIYKGLFVEGNSSKGVLLYVNGDIYEGQFKDGCRHGTGTIKYYIPQTRQYQQYSGKWVKDKKNGQGTYKSKQFIISGVWQNQTINGQAFIKDFKNNWQYRGLVSNEQLVKGKIKILFNPNQSYEGQVYKGKFEGQGKYIQTIQSNKNIYQYEGQFRQGKIQGIGKINLMKKGITKNAIIQQYQGKFDNKPIFSGKAKVKYTNGDIFEGNFKQGLKNGQGIYKFNNGDIYEGQFKDDKISGQGKYYWKTNNLSYFGLFQNSQINNNKNIVSNLNNQIHLKQSIKNPKLNQSFSIMPISYKQNPITLNINKQSKIQPNLIQRANYIIVKPNRFSLM